LIPLIRNWGDRLFPEFQILFRRGGRIAYINLTAMRQAVMIATICVAVSLVVYLGARFQHFGHVVLSRNFALAVADREKSALSQENAALRDALMEAEGRAQSIGEENDKLGSDLASAKRRIDALEDERNHALADAQKRIDEADTEHNRALADAQKRIDQLDHERARLQSDHSDIAHRLANTEDKLNAKATNATELAKELDEDRDLLRHSDSNQATLMARIQTLETELEKVNTGSARAIAGQFKADLTSIERKLQDLSVERDRLHTADARFEDKVGGQGSALEPLAGGRVETLLAATGLDVAKLLNDIEIDTTASHGGGEGGPFVALGSAGAALTDAQRRQSLQKLVETLPLTAPLDEPYRFESPFGPRIDPINHRRAFHTGVDLSAPYRTHVMSTAPGIVIFAGAEGEFGRMVEIDHGHGIVTRYAHLHRTFVVKGQKVPAHFPIGELGSTGRSTGPHVHYEVLVDGTPLDPAKFMGAGKNVVQAATE
jgi:murein DD-endopeptidase MepM/ murein hydrolase activator NlpD